MKLTAIKVEQSGNRVFLTAVQAKQLTDEFCRPDAWSPQNREGYQRDPNEARFKNIAEYMEGKQGTNPILPQAIVLNSRKKLKFKEGDNGIGVLEIPDDALPLFEVDGQHRVGGARRAVQETPELGEYQFPVTIIEGLNLLHEAVMFFVINTRQRRVPTDLAQRIISNEMEDPNLRRQLIEEGKDWLAKATRVVDIMNEEEGQPWRGVIGVPGHKVRYILKQNSFVQSLRPILKNDPTWRASPAEDVGRALVHYWKALRDAFPEAFTDPKEYVIQKTVGVFPLHAVAPMVFELAVRRRGYPLKPEPVKEVVRDLAEKLQTEYCEGNEASYFWHRKDGEAGRYAGAKGFAILERILLERLPEQAKPKVA